MIKSQSRGRLRMTENVKYVLRDAQGNVKPIFQDNKFFKFLINKGIVSPHFTKIPFLLGSWAQFRTQSNLVVSAGSAGVASRINGAGAEAAFTYVSIGIGTTSPVAGNTALETERDQDGATNTTHKSAAASRTTTDVTNDTATLIVTFSFTATLAVTESGVHNATPDGTMLARQTFSAINVANGDSLQVTWDFDVD